MCVLHPTFRHNFLMLKISHQRIMTVRKCRTTGYPGSWSGGEMSSNGPVPSGGTTWSGKSNKWRTVAHTAIAAKAQSPTTTLATVHIGDLAKTDPIVRVRRLGFNGLPPADWSGFR